MAPASAAPKTEDVVAVDVALPGVAVVDKTMLDEAVHEINRIHGGKALETARSVAEYVVATFFGGDVDNFKKRGLKHATYKALANRDDLNMSYSAIDKSVRVLEQLRLFSSDVAAALPYAHHQLLLPVRDPEQKVRLAQEVVDKQLPKRLLEERVKKLRAKQASGEKRGRKPQPSFAKAITQVRKALPFVLADSVNKEVITAYGAKEAKKSLKELRAAIDQLTALGEAIEAGLAD